MCIRDRLREVLNNYMNAFENEPEKYDHLSDADKTKVIEKTANTAKWLDDMLYKQSEMPKNVDPKLTTDQIFKAKDDVIYTCTPILTKPKPPRAPPANEAPKQDANAQQQQQQQGQQQQPEGENPEAKQGDMDVD